MDELSMKFNKMMMQEMGIETGIDMERILRIGRQLERTVGRRLRSDSIIHGKLLKEANEDYKRKGLKERKAKLGEKPGQRFSE